MSRILMLRSSLSVLALFVCLLGHPAFAQQPRPQSCPEGKTAAGQCVNPGLAASIRLDAIIFALPRISFTAFPLLPTDDGQYRYPNQFNPNPLRPSASGVGNGGTLNTSDIRLKRDIVSLAHFDNGIGLYRFRYNWSDTYYVGVMAQEVMNVVPAAVVQGLDGYLRVDYGRLGLKFQTWDEWMGSTKGLSDWTP